MSWLFKALGIAMFMTVHANATTPNATMPNAMMPNANTPSTTLWVEHQVGQPWQQASVENTPLALQTWLLHQPTSNWPHQLQAMLQQHYCQEDMTEVAAQATQSHFVPGNGQVLLSQQMQRQLGESSAMHLQPWTRLTAQQAQSRLPVYLLADRANGMLQSILLAPGQAPQTLWQFSFLPPKHSESFSESLPLAIADIPQRQPVLVLPARNQFGVQLLNPASGRVIPFSNSDDGDIIRATAMPTTLDTDLNGALDRIYQISDDGQLYRLQVSQNLQVRRSLVADLRQTGWRYDDALTASRARWPKDASWQVGDVVVLQARSEQGQQLLVLKIPEHLDAVMQYQELSLQQSLAAPASSHQGWRMAFSGRMAAMPSIMAGVLYLPLMTEQPPCAGSVKMDKLLALHLYYGNAVYAEPMIELPNPLAAKFAINAHGNTLRLMAESQTILPQMLGARSDCAGCSELLQPSQFPKWQRIASFQPETGVF